LKQSVLSIHGFSYFMLTLAQTFRITTDSGAKKGAGLPIDS